MATKRNDITPVFNQRQSIALVDTAENLVDNLDKLSVCLKHREEKYVETDMNQTVDVLSFRIVELENALCEAEEVQETSNAEQQDIQKQLEDAHTGIAEVQQKETGLQKQVHELKSQRTDAALRQQYQEMSDKMDILLIENKRLKEIIREKDICEIKSSTSADSQFNSSI